MKKEYTEKDLNESHNKGYKCDYNIDYIMGEKIILRKFYIN